MITRDLVIGLIGQVGHTRITATVRKIKNSPPAGRWIQVKGLTGGCGAFAGRREVCRGRVLGDPGVAVCCSLRSDRGHRASSNGAVRPECRVSWPDQRVLMTVMRHLRSGRCWSALEVSQQFC